MNQISILRLILLSLCLSCVAYGQEKLTNESIVEMHKAGLASAVIVSKVRNSEVSFDTTLAGLKALSDAGIPESVVSAMIEADAGSRSKQAASEAAQKNKPSAIASPLFVTYNELDKDGQKQRLKSPAVVQIAAPASDIIPLLIRGFQSWDYQVDEETSRSVSLSKPAKSFGDQLLIGLAMGGNNWRYKIQASVAEYQGIASVSVRAFVASDNVFGKTSQHQLDDSKKWRSQLDDLLRAVKVEAERNLSRRQEPSTTGDSSSIAPAANPNGFPVRWKSMSTGIVRVLRMDGDFIYTEAELTQEQKDLGIYQRGEVKKDGDHYAGKVTSPIWFWWKTNPVTGKKYAEKICWIDDLITLKIISPTRIEIEGDQFPAGTKFDKNCKPDKKKMPHPASVWIPLDEPSK